MFMPRLFWSRCGTSKRLRTVCYRRAIQRPFERQKSTGRVERDASIERREQEEVDLGAECEQAGVLAAGTVGGEVEDAQQELDGQTVG